MHSPLLLPLSSSSSLPSALRQAGSPTPLLTNAHLLAARRRWLPRRKMKAPEVWDRDVELLQRCWPFSVDGGSNPSRHRVGSRTAVRLGVLSVWYGRYDTWLRVVCGLVSSFEPMIWVATRRKRRPLTKQSQKRAKKFNCPTAMNFNGLESSIDQASKLGQDSSLVER